MNRAASPSSAFRRLLLPIALLAAAVAVFIALALHRVDGERTSATAGDERGARDPEAAAGGRDLSRAVTPGLARSLPRFIQAKTRAAGTDTLQADLLEDEGSRQAADTMMAQQARDPGWAPRMEQHLGERLGPAALARLGLSDLGLRVVGLECRTFGCQVSIEWSPDALAARVPPPFPPATAPLRHIHDQAGPLAAAVLRRARERGPDGRARETYLLFYRDDLREPGAWLATGP